jgi:hypothetical protein
MALFLASYRHYNDDATMKNNLWYFFNIIYYSLLCQRPGSPNLGSRGIEKFASHLRSPASRLIATIRKFSQILANASQLE